MARTGPVRIPVVTWRPRVVDLLTRMGVAMRRRGDPRRARAYLRAATAVQRRKDFDDLLEAGRLREVVGIGPSIDRSIREFVATGEPPAWVEEAMRLPATPEESAAVAAAAATHVEAIPVPDAWREAPFPETPDLHVHSVWSDGSLAVEEIVRFAERLGLPAVGVSDHSGSLTIARGLDPGSVRAQWEELDRIQADHPDVRILRGTECDILRDGRLDHPPEILEGFDYVIGSLHSHLKLPEDEQTERVLRALDEPRLTILGHPTTRIPRTRPPANLDLDSVFEKAAAKGVALEVNGNPGRLDLNADLARKALRAGCRLSLGSDAHTAEEMLALATARRTAEKAGAAEEDLVNAHLLARAQRRPDLRA